MAKAKYISSKRVIQYLLIYLFTYFPLSILCFSVFFCFPIDYESLLYVCFPLFCMGVFFCMEIFLLLRQVVVVVIKRQQVLEDDFYRNIRLIKFEKKVNNIGIHGIIEGKEFDNIDKNDDGKIMVSEFYPLTEQEVLGKIGELDTNFSKTEFYSYVKSVFFLIKKAFLKKDSHILRSFEEDSLYRNHKLLVESDNFSNSNSEVRVKGVLLKDFKVDGNMQVIDVAITVRIIDKSTVDADRFEDIPLIMVFARNKNFKMQSRLSTSNCLNCGAVIDVDDNGVCNYCGTSLVSGDLGWVLIDIRRFDLVHKDMSDSVNNTMKWYMGD